MAIPESQLKIWSHQGAITMAKTTADSIKNALNTYDDWPEGAKFEVYLQGSYKNDTNIRGDMDVDIVVQLNSSFCSNLNEQEKNFLGIIPARYGWSEFRNDVLKALRDYYGFNNVSEGNKSIKIKSGSNRLPADVVVCVQYRKYNLQLNDFIEGMCFWSRNDNRQIINYPKIHYDNGVSKHQNSNGWYKPLVRMFKNMRGYLEDNYYMNKDLVPSYFLECMLYNVPNSKFGTSYQNTFCNVVNWLGKANLDDFVCQNEQLNLFGSTPEQWNTNQAKEFIKNLILLWDNWNR